MSECAAWDAASGPARLTALPCTVEPVRETGIKFAKASAKLRREGCWPEQLLRLGRFSTLGTLRQSDAGGRDS